MKIKNKKKFVTSISIVFLICMFIIIFSKQTFSHGEYETKIIYISRGDTLWSLASMEQESNEYYEDRSIREIMEDIKNINNLDNSNLFEGQKLKIPTL